MIENFKVLGEIETENYGNVPILDIHMITNEEEHALAVECKRKHPELYTPEKMAEYRAFIETPCNVPQIKIC